LRYVYSGLIAVVLFSLTPIHAQEPPGFCEEMNLSNVPYPVRLELLYDDAEPNPDIVHKDAYVEYDSNHLVISIQNSTDYFTIGTELNFIEPSSEQRNIRYNVVSNGESFTSGNWKASGFDFCTTITMNTVEPVVEMSIDEMKELVRDDFTLVFDEFVLTFEGYSEIIYAIMLVTSGVGVIGIILIVHILYSRNGNTKKEKKIIREYKDATKQFQELIETGKTINQHNFMQQELTLDFFENKTDSVIKKLIHCVECKEPDPEVLRDYKKKLERLPVNHENLPEPIPQSDVVDEVAKMYGVESPEKKQHSMVSKVPDILRENIPFISKKETETSYQDMSLEELNKEYRIYMNRWMQDKTDDYSMEQCKLIHQVIQEKTQ